MLHKIIHPPIRWVLAACKTLSSGLVEDIVKTDADFCPQET